jgi:hypothetical protein
MSTLKPQPYSEKVINLITAEINDFETGYINLSNRVTFSQYQTVQDNITQQNKGFLTSLAPGQEDDREFYDIITPMIETAVVNIDLDIENLEPYVDNPNYIAHEYFAKAILKNYWKQTNHGIVLNEVAYQLVDDGNIFVRRINDNGEIFRPVLPQNLYIVDQAAMTLEDTAVIEKDRMNQSEMLSQKEWDNVDRVEKLCNTGDDQIPYYEIYYRYGELSVQSLRNVMKEVHGKGYSYKTGDNSKYVQSLVVMAKPRTGIKDEEGNQVQGLIVFAEELKPEKFKITSKLTVTRFKPFEFARLGKFNGRLWGEGYREIGRPYQNRANELGNQIRAAMKLAMKLVFWSSDKKIAGKNILSSINHGQIIKADSLNLLNNVFPNLSLFAEEWNRNINECTKALKAFEVASGEALPSSTSATAVNIQNVQIGKYFNFKRERLGLLYTTIGKRWVLKKLLDDVSPEEAIELVGDPAFVETVVDTYLNGWVIENVLKITALSGGSITKPQLDELLAIKKEELLKQPKLYGQIFKDFFKDVEVYVGFNPTGEAFNKQGVITNTLKLLELEANPAISQNPGIMATINELKIMLGLKPSPKTEPLPQQPNPTNPVSPQGQLPQKEPSLQEQPV